MFRMLYSQLSQGWCLRASRGPTKETADAIRALEQGEGEMYETMQDVWGHLDGGVG